MHSATLTVFVDRTDERAEEAVEQVRSLHRDRLAAECEFEVVDVNETPGPAREAGVMAVPAVTYACGETQRRVVGHMADVDRLLDALGIVTDTS